MFFLLLSPKTSMIRHTVFVFICLLGISSAHAQVSMFDDSETVELVKNAANHIYGMNNDSAQYYIDQVQDLRPNHPIVPMMEAVRVLWTNIPVLQGAVFDQFNGYLLTTVERAQELPSGHPDAIFFEMSARGLLAEYYADRGAYMKAFNEASKAYSLLKEGFELSETYPEFLFAVGLYNYFREAYPERHPIYKSLVWLFRGGDKELGIAQLNRATNEAIIIKVEAFVYLSYIYLRYEENPAKAQGYITRLLAEYPNNLYVQSKYLEAYYSAKEYEKLDPDLIAQLRTSDKKYYQLVGLLFAGIRAEIIKEDRLTAIQLYSESLKLGEDLPEYADYYKSLAHLGLGRSYHFEGDQAQANYHLAEAISRAETSDVKEEARKWMK
jgi:tetratricopeptide (TPR) repeat protein